MKVRTMQVAALVMLFLSMAIVRSYAQTEEWRVTYDFSIGARPNLYPAQDIGRKIGFDAAGNIYVFVSTMALGDRMSDNSKEYVVFKYDTYGNKLWCHRGEFNSSFGKSFSFRVDPQGNVYGAFTSFFYYYASPDNYGGGKHDANIFKLNSDGSLAWLKSWNNETFNSHDYAKFLDVDVNGNVYFVIESNFGTTANPFFRPVIQKYDPNGNKLWETTGEQGIASDIDIDNDGNIYVLFPGIVRKYSSGAGALLSSGEIKYWWDDNGLETNPTHWASANCVDIEVASDGNFYVAGASKQRNWYWVGPDYDDWESEYHDNFFTAKFESDCNLLWRDEYGTYEYEEYASELVIDNDGNILVTGPANYQLATLKYLPDGTRDGTYLYSDDDAQFHINGGYVYTIETPYSGPHELHKYFLSTGVEQWNFPLTGLLTHCDFRVHPSGNLYLTGSVDDGEGLSGSSAGYADDMVLIKYGSAPLLETPTNYVALSGYHGAIPFAWAPPQEEAQIGYNVYRSTSSGGSYTKIASMINHQYYSDENVVNGQTYYYKVTAVYNEGESDFTPAASGTPSANGYKIYSVGAQSVPDFDGVINTGEWSGATQMNITYPGESDVVTLYTMNSDNYLYLAVDDQGNTTLDNYDTFGIFFDENHNREWPSTNTGEEGLLQLFWNGSNPAASFMGFYGTWPDQVQGSSSSTPSGINLGISVSSGHVQMEAGLNLTSCPLNVSAEDEFGVLFYTYEGASTTLTGVWPQETVQNLVPLTSGYAWAHGPFSYGDLKIAEDTGTDEPDKVLPKEFNLSQNYPNPFNPKTTIRYELPVSSEVELTIYNSSGRKVVTLVRGRQNAGVYEYEWDASGHSSGLYLCQLQTKNGLVKTRKFLLMK